MTRTGHDLGHPALPDERRDDLRRAVRLEIISLAYLLTCVGVVAATMGNSQAMKAAWIEDLLSLVPPIAFLVAVRVARRPPDPEHPYGHHRAVATGHLVASVALLTMGLYLLYDNVSTLVVAEHPSIGTVQLFGLTVWQGWLMVAAMIYTGVGPVVLGRLKLPLAERLHDKVLHADADMNKADWMTAAGAVLGVVGIGLGLWWADAVAALAIAVSVLRDGVRNVRNAVDALVDARAHTVDDSEPHPLNEAARQRLVELEWVSEVGIRVRDQGHVFHLEAFVVPQDEQVAVRDLERAAELLEELDWKIHDVVVTVVSELPEGKVFVTRGEHRS